MAQNESPAPGQTLPPPAARQWKSRYRLATLLSIAALAIGLIHVWRSVDEDDRVMRQQLLRQVRLIASAINPDDVTKLRGNHEDSNNPQYHRLKRQFEILSQTIPNVHFVYLMGHRNNGEIFFFLDNAPAGSEPYVPPGQAYDDATNAFRKAVITGTELTEGPLRDRWGTWVSAITPIIKPVSAQTVATLGIDIDAHAWQKQLHHKTGAKTAFVVAAWLVALASISLCRRLQEGNSRLFPSTHALITVIAALLGAAITIYGAWRSHEKETFELQDIFYRMAESQTSISAKRIHGIASAELAGLADFFASRIEPSPAEFSLYVRHLTNNSLVDLWGWVEPVNATDQDAQRERFARLGLADFKIWEPGPNLEVRPARGRDTLFPVLYYAPQRKNEQILGIDLSTHPRRRLAINEAIKTHLPSVTSPVDLGFNKYRKGMVIFHPVASPTDPEKLQGLAFAGIRFDLLLVNRESSRNELMHLSLSSLNDDGSREVLCDTGKELDCPRQEPFVRPLFAFGQVFLLTAHPNASFFLAHPRRRCRSFLLTGLILTATFATIANLILRHREQLLAVSHNHDSTLSEAKLLFNQLAEQSRTVQWRCAPDGRFTEVNPVAERVFGYKPEQLVGTMTLFDLHPQVGKESFMALMQGVLQQRETFIDLSKLVQTANGNIVKISSSGTPIIDNDGQLVGFYGWDRDVTDREELAEKLLKSQHAAETANQAKSEFLTNMSHEIRTPINGVVAFSDLLRVTPLNNEQREYVDVIGSSSCQLLGLVNELLDFAQISASQLKIDQHDFNLRITVQDLCCQLAINAHVKNIELVCKIPPELPILLHGDELHLQQAIACLLDNAVKFTNEGEVVINVDVENEQEKNVIVRFTISDTGMGIGPGLQQHIFDSFFQADSSIKRRHGGAGLGLSIAKHLVELMGGTLNFTSQLGRGSVFSIALPLGKQGNARPKFHPAPDRLVGAPVLVVDGNDSARDVLCQCLNHKKLQAVGAKSLHDALASLRQAKQDGKPFLIILVDLSSPDVGIESADALRQAGGPDLALVSLVPLGKRHVLDPLIRRFSLQVITKPIRQNDLWHCLHTVCNHLKNPAANASEAADASAPPTEKAAAANNDDSSAPTSRCVLLVEDHPVNQKVALIILEKAGYHADLAINGLEALRMLSSKAYDLVLMDIQMPEMDGLEATRRIRDESFPALNRHAPIIAMTAHAVIGYRENCLNAGMNDFLTKPFTASQLRQIITRWLR